MANNVCMSYLEKMIPVFNDKMQAALQSGDRTTMKHYQALWMESTKKKKSWHPKGESRQPIDLIDMRHGYANIHTGNKKKSDEPLSYSKFDNEISF